MATNDFVVKNGLVVNENATIKEVTDAGSSTDSAASVYTAGGLAVAKKAYIGTNLDVQGTSNLVGNVTLTGDIAVNGGDLTTTATTLNVFNANATTVDAFEAATTLNIGATTGTATIQNDTVSVKALTATGAITVNTTTNNQSYSTTGAGVISITSGTAGNINNMNIGASTRGTGAFTTLTSNAATTLTLNTDATSSTAGGTLTVTGGAAVSGKFYAGSIQGTPIGGTTRSTGAFTTLTANDATTLTLGTDATSSTAGGTLTVTGGLGVSGRIYAGSIQNTPIGSSVQSSGQFTTVAASGQVNFTAGTAAGNGTGTVTVSGGMYLSGAVWAAGSSTLAGLSSTSTTTLSPSNASVLLQPTGTGTVTVGPATLGTINNMSIGATTRSTGAFTTLDANSTVGLSPANASVTISPTGTGTVTIGPATLGTINNMSIGATTASTGRFTTVTSTQATGTAPFTVASTTLVSNLNADLHDGYHVAEASTVSTVVARNASGDINVRLVRSEFGNDTAISGAMAFRVNNSTDNYIRFISDTAAIRTFLDVPTRTGTNASGTWAISVSGNAATATDSTNATNASLMVSFDDRAIIPTDVGVSRMRYGFASWANNNTAPYADYLLMRGYGDSSGGNDNLVMFRKDAIGLRIYQAGFGSASAFSTYKDVAFTTDVHYIGTTSIALNRASASQSLTGVSIDGSAGTAGTVTTAAQPNITSVGTLTSLTSSGNISGTGHFGTSVQINGNGSSNDPYGTVAVTEPANANNYSYYGLTRAGQIGTGFGLTGTNGALGLGANSFWFGSATNSTAGVMSAGWLAFNGSSMVISGTFTEQSSIRFKENVKPIDSALDKVLQLQGVTYDKKDGSSFNEPGLIAEDVLKVVPELVQMDQDGEANGIHYTKITAYLIECIKELNAKIDKLEGKNV